MKPINVILFLLIFFQIFFFSQAEEIITNPTKIEKDSNPVNYIIIFESETAGINSLTLNVKKNFVKFPHDSYLLTLPIFVFVNEQNKNNMFLEDKYFMFDFDQNNELQNRLITNNDNLPSNISDIKFTDYIMGIKYNQVSISKDKMSKIDVNEIIFYGKNGENVSFYFMFAKKYYTVHFGNIDDQVSCKVIKEAIFICAYTENYQIKLKFLVLVFLEDSNKELKDLYESNIFKFNGYDSAILYNTSNSNYKVICGRNKFSSNILCLGLYLDFDYSDSSASFTKNDITVYDLDSGYQTSYLFNNNYCNFTKYNSEYLVCCKNNTGLICDRRDENTFVLIESFNLDLQTNITNISLETDENDNKVKLYYSNNEGVYEYLIYQIDCNNVSLTLKSYETLKINFDDLFQRKTNTKYYFFVKNELYSNLMQTKVNEERITNIMDKKELNDNDNYLYFISVTTSSKTKIIYYYISNLETYSNLCSIKIEYKSCYSSCKGCSISEDGATNEDHYCIECKEGFYPFSEKETNCYEKSGISITHPDWYLDENTSMFYKCNSGCKTCYGPSEENCLTCPLDGNNNVLYLFNGKCINKCPTGTFVVNDNNGNYSCENCYINCLTCSEGGTPSDMKCDSCSNDKISYGNQCYEVVDNTIKNFYNPENISQITSCFELLNIYIKENTYTCIPDIEEGYYISNSQTGLLSPCDSNCKTCSQISTHCDSCNNGFYLQDNICVSSCSSQYYLVNNNCFKCYDNCLSCLSGKELDESGKLINMKCSECLNNNMIKVDDNCFKIINYEENKITFNINEIKSDKTVGTCLDFNKAIFYGSYECINKPENSF